MELDSDRRYRFPVPPDALWSALADTDEHQRWWPWLRDFEAGGLHPGDDWRCTVRPPLGYSLRFTIHLDEVEPPQLVTAHLTGDIAGSARVEIAPHPEGCEVRLASQLAPASRTFGILAIVARPVVRRGHDWVLDAGARQFVARVTAPS